MFAPYPTAASPALSSCTVDQMPVCNLSHLPSPWTLMVGVVWVGGILFLLLV